MSGELWYAFDAVDEDRHLLAIVGPVKEGEERADGLEWTATFATTGSTGLPVLFNHIETFDHQPSEEEQYSIIPEGYRSQYAKRFADTIAGSPELHEDAELHAVFLAIDGRVQQLEEIVSRSEMSKLAPSVVRAAKDQIQVLVKFARDNNLTPDRFGDWPLA